MDAAALNITLPPDSSLFVKYSDFSSSFKPLLLAFISTGKVTNWNKNITISAIIPIQIKSKDPNKHQSNIAK